MKRDPHYRTKEDKPKVYTTSTHMNFVGALTFIGVYFLILKDFL